HSSAREASESVDTKTQIVFQSEVETERPKDSAHRTEEPKLKESGHVILMSEGNRFVLLQGTEIHTTLLNRLEGSFTGPVKCVVSEDVISEDGMAVLIPRGKSVFYGESRKVEAENQMRLAVTFSRLVIRKEASKGGPAKAYSVELDTAPGLDSSGATGL